jgi:hypothetical protein
MSKRIKSSEREAIKEADLFCIKNADGKFFKGLTRAGKASFVKNGKDALPFKTESEAENRIAYESLAFAKVEKL